jgi:hypothetical protein
MYVCFDRHVGFKESVARLRAEEVQSEKHDNISSFLYDIKCLLDDRKCQVEWWIGDNDIMKRIGIRGEEVSMELCRRVVPDVKCSDIIICVAFERCWI